MPINIKNNELFTGGCQSHADSVERATGWHWNAGALERLVEDDDDAADSATGRLEYCEPEAASLLEQQRDEESLQYCE